jgi:ethanolamine kinase
MRILVEETRSHALLASMGLAPPLLARFRNGLLYRFIRGKVATPNDLEQPAVWRAVAHRLAQWHAVLPINDAPDISVREVPHQNLGFSDADLSSKTTTTDSQDDITPITSSRQGSTLWTVTQKWILALPTTTEEERSRRKLLQKEFERIVAELDDGQGLGEDGVSPLLLHRLIRHADTPEQLVFSHCDLLSANVVIHPHSDPETRPDTETVSFIDYEYATPSPAAFDLANHFAEWAGYDCDFTRLPTCSVRRGFIREYIKSYTQHAAVHGASEEEMVEKLYKDVDRFRGIPGFCW